MGTPLPLRKQKSGSGRDGHVFNGHPVTRFTGIYSAQVARFRRRAHRVVVLAELDRRFDLLKEANEDRPIGDLR
jgi:hypothetical protein